MWQNLDGKLVREFHFINFKQAMAFVNQVGEIAENINHHPYIIIQYNKVQFSLCTYDQGNAITQLDYQLAEAINQLVK
jgi:4a-hydroxytetrahydrobiopterin dehydratase